MGRLIKIKKGLDISMESKPIESCIKDNSTLFAIIPDDFPGYTWKASVREGDSITTGNGLFYAKENPDITLCAPVGGIVKEIKRGERRKIEYISIEKGENQSYIKADDSLSILQKIAKHGYLALIRQRPFDIVPQTGTIPVNIFVTAFDSTPLAGDLLDNPLKEYLESGLEALSQLTSGKVYLGARPGSGITSKIAEVYEFAGPHPAGNTGTQMAAISPVNKGETVWMLDALTACRIGKLIKTGNPDYSARIIINGSEVDHAHVVDTYFGAKISTVLEQSLSDDKKDIRIISGNVLTGIKVERDTGFIHYPYRQITVIEEGDKNDEFMGWASINPKRYSVSHAFPAFLRGLSKPFHFDARIKGGERAMIMSGEYDKVFPMDIYPEYLIKAIVAKNIEKMEQRGIYEVAPEDFALAEFVDSSKMELQKIVREGLDYLRKETL